LLRIGKEVMRAGADKVGTADFRICDRELGIATLSTSTNELVSCKGDVVSLNPRSGGTLKLVVMMMSVIQVEETYLP
jgi:hypothetical protein